MSTKKNLKKFGDMVYKLRLENGLTLREICRRAGYDPSNWSKMERGLISPPSEKKKLESWALILGIKKSSKELDEFVYLANVAQGIIPFDVMKEKELVASLPAFFRTLKNKKPTKEEVDNIINLIKNA